MKKLRMRNNGFIISLRSISDNWVVLPQGVIRLTPQVEQKRKLDKEDKPHQEHLVVQVEMR